MTEIPPEPSCISLIDIAEVEDGADLTLGLCPVCLRVDFVGLLGAIERTSPVENQGPPAANGLPTGSHYHIGTLRRTVARAETCPACRLIRSAACSTGPLEDSALDAEVLIDTQFLNESNKVIGVVLASREFNPRTVGYIVPAALPASIGSLPHEPALFEQTQSLGRRIGPHVDIDLIKGWIYHCDKVHGDACRASIAGDSAVRAKRFIDVMERRVVPAPPHASYYALSYVWGPDVVPLLTIESLTRFSTLGELNDNHEQLPRTIVDSMTLVASLGGRYLWVDNLCIVQDDERDKQHQLTRMDDIYHDATAVIAVALSGEGGNARRSIPGVVEPRNIPEKTIETVQNLRLVNVRPGVLHVITRTAWDSRGWTYQESRLARRIIILTEHLVYWLCRREILQEDLCLGKSSFDLPRPPSDAPAMELGQHWVKEDPNSIPCRTKEYCSHARQFARRRFTNNGDTLWAFIGVLKLLKGHFPAGFIWGIPYECLDAAMLWSRGICNHGMCNSEDRKTGRHLVYYNDCTYSLPFPSWSWLYVIGDIKFTDECGDSLVSHVQWHEPIKLGSERQQDLFKRFAKNEKNNVNFDMATSPTEYGYLRLTVKIATLCIRAENMYPEHMDMDFWLEVSLHTESGVIIGRTLVLRSFFKDGNKMMGEFALLSTNAGHGHEKDPSHNVLLIEEGEDGIYRRVEIAEVQSSHWAKVSTKERTIILG